MRLLGEAEGEVFEPSSDPKARNGFRDRTEHGTLQALCFSFASWFATLGHSARAFVCSADSGTSRGAMSLSSDSDKPGVIGSSAGAEACGATDVFSSRPVLSRGSPVGRVIAARSVRDPFEPLAAASDDVDIRVVARIARERESMAGRCPRRREVRCCGDATCRTAVARDRKSTRLNSSHVKISYAVFCLKKKKKIYIIILFLKKNNNNKNTTL